MKKVLLSKAEINQISMCLFAFKIQFQNLSVSMPLTDSLIERFNSLKDEND